MMKTSNYNTFLKKVRNIFVANWRLKFSLFFQDHPDANEHKKTTEPAF